MSFLFSHVAGSTTLFRWARIQENRDWLLPVLIAVLLVFYFVRRYRLDAVDLMGWQRFVPATLRAGAIVALLLFYFQPQWEHLVGSSRVAVLIDTSASMGHRDLVAPQDVLQPPDAVVEASSAASPSSDGEFVDQAVGPTRLEGVVDWMRRSDLVERLAEKHDVAVYGFDRTLRRFFVRQHSGGGPVDVPEAGSDSEQDDAGRLDSLKSDGEETRLGEALLEILQRERGRPLAGVLLLSDGGQNAGRGVDASLESARRLRIPICPIGVGTTQPPLNFRVGVVDTPDRAYPGDPFTVKVPVEMSGGDGTDALESRTIPVELRSKSDGEETETKVGEKAIHFARSGVVEVEFEIRADKPGKRTLTAKIMSPKEDRNPADDRQQADVEIVDRKDRVLLFASAPTRDYQFLCAQIARDKSMSVDAFLPWAQPGSSQNAETILRQFPSTRAEMSKYDVVVAFDPNWLDLSTEQIDLLEYWVARLGGGLVLVAGPIHQADTVTGWVSDIGMEKIRALYPVEFLARQSAFEHRYHGDTQARPLRWTREGEDAEFLRPVDDPVEARSFWNRFPGFYGFFAVKGVKPTATLLASSGSTELLGRADSGALIVRQYYGAGRVLYLGSGELWRLRRLDERAFERVATRILRHVAQGRLQRESDRGSISVDKRRYSLGSIAQIRLVANDSQLRPLTLPTWPLDVLAPSGTLRTIDTSLDSNTPGTYTAHLPLTEEGTWSIRFTLPESDQQLTRTLQVRMGDLERENPSRNESLLLEIASKSDGRYYRSPNEALAPVRESNLYGDIDFFAAEPTDPGRAVTELLRVRSQRAVVDKAIEAKTMRLFLMTICACLLLEWTLRRLMKLA